MFFTCLSPHCQECSLSPSFIALVICQAQHRATLIVIRDCCCRVARVSPASLPLISLSMLYVVQDPGWCQHHRCRKSECMKPNDWSCPTCQFHNYARKQAPSCSQGVLTDTQCISKLRRLRRRTGSGGPRTHSPNSGVVRSQVPISVSEPEVVITLT